MMTYDVIIIGGGIAGLSAAAFLSETAKVAVLEAEPHLGYHSTGRSAAIFIRNYGNDTLRALNDVAASFFETDTRVLKDRVLSPRGELLIAKADELDAIDTYCDGATGLQRLVPQEACELVPILNPDSFAAAVFEQDAQDIDVDRLLQSYVSYLRAQQGQILTDQRVQNIAKSDVIWTVSTDQDSYQAPIVVNAAGAWGDHIGEMAGLRPLGLQPYRRSAVIMAVPDTLGCKNWPLFGSIQEDWYAKPDAGRLMISPADQDPVAAQDVYPDDMVLAEGLYRFEQATTLPVTRPLRSWAGLRSFLPDRTPAVGFDSVAPGFFWLIGQGGYGVQTSPALGKLTRDLIVSKQSQIPDCAISALAPDRFFS